MEEEDEDEGKMVLIIMVLIEGRKMKWRRMIVNV